MDCSLPGSSVHGIFQEIVLEWIAISFSRGSSQPRVRTQVSCIVDRRFTIWTTREVWNKSKEGIIFKKKLRHWEIKHNKNNFHMDQSASKLTCVTNVSPASSLLPQIHPSWTLNHQVPPLWISWLLSKHPQAHSNPGSITLKSSVILLSDPPRKKPLPTPEVSRVFTQTHVHRVGDAIQPSHPLLSPSPLAFNLSQHQGLFQRVSSFHQLAKVLEFQLQHQSFQWIFRVDFL